jgi:hypothetical protein
MKRTCHVISILLLIGFVGSFGCGGGGGGNGGVEEPPVIPPQKAAQMDYPMPIGDEEGGVFGFTNSGDPLKDANLDDLYYLRVMVETVDKTKSIYKSSSASGINMEALGPHNITVYGTKVVLKKWNGSENANGLYEKINNNYDLKNLTIYADRVEIHNRIFIPGANVKIHAREFVFVRNNDTADSWACIDTSPEESIYAGFSGETPLWPPTFDKAPNDYTGKPVNGGYAYLENDEYKVQDSKKGGDAGNVFLNIGSFDPSYTDTSYEDGSSADHTMDRFVLKGANGEHAGQGRAGVKGDDVPKVYFARTTNAKYNYESTQNESEWNTLAATYPNIKSEACIKYMVPNIIEDWQGGDIPTNGKNAVNAGKPGIGGNGGSVYSTVSMQTTLSNLVAGNSGQQAYYMYNNAKASTYKGGRHGWPQKGLENVWRRLERIVNGQTEYYWELASSVVKKTTVDGSDITAPLPDKIRGDDGSFQPIAKQYSYLHPSMLHQVIIKGKDIFLRGYRDYALTYFEQYIALIDSYQASAEWTAADINATEREQIVQAELEMRQIVQRIRSGLDYFGNPAGWVPMVSVEVTMAAYENEINNAMQAMYLKYWLSKDFRSNVDIVQSATSMRQNAIDDIVSLKTEYSKQIAALKELEPKAAEIDGKCTALEAEIEKQRQYYINKAKDSLKADKFSKVCGVASTMLKACPVGQPYTTMGAAGLDLMAKQPSSLGEIASTLAPYKSIGKSLCEMYKPVFSRAEYCMQFGDSLNEKMNIFSNGLGLSASLMCYDPNPNNLSLYQIAKPIVKAGFKEIPDAFKDSAIPQGAVEKIANQLMAESWDFQTLMRELKVVLKEKGEIAAKMLETNEKINAAISGIAIKTQTVKQLSGYIVNNASIGFAPAAVYVDEMDQQARERLLKYHYYMAKAYEYRMLKRYEGNLTVQNVFDTILRQYEQTNNNGAIGTNRLLTAEQFASLKSIYQNEISKVVQEMYTYKVNNPPAYGMPVSFRLSTQQIEELNEQGRLRINPVRMNIFYDTEENIRINDVRIYFKTDVDGAFPGNSGYVELKTTHGGVSVIDYKGNRYLFKHYNNMTESLKSWATRKDLVRGTEYFSKPSASETTLFGTLMKNNDSDMAYYSLPSARADMDVIKKVQTSNGQKVNITEVIIEISYEYSELDNCSMVKILAANNSLAPTIAVDREDTCKQTSGFGYFTRTYPHGDGSVLFTAPATYGEWTFSKWVNGCGETISTTPQVQVDLGDVAIIRPIYTNPEVTE